MQVEKLTGGPLGVNTYVLYAPGRDDCIVIDPGVPMEQIRRAVGVRRVAAVLLTHAHFDHMLSAAPLREAGAQLYVHRLDAPMLTDARLNLSGMIGERLTLAPADRLLEEGDAIEAAGLRLSVLHTPGHTPGGVCYRLEETLFTGDTMFAGGYGRTDFPGGDGARLLASLRRLAALDGSLCVRPGHGADTAIAAERRTYL